MSYTDQVATRLRDRGVVVVDARQVLPHNTAYPYIRQWNLRDVDGVDVIAYHYPAGPARPEPSTDPTIQHARDLTRLSAWARGHINQVWGSGVVGGKVVQFHAPTLTYHLTVGAGGAVYLCNNLEYLTWHASDANARAIGVLTDVGENQEPHHSQLVSLQHLAEVFDLESPEIPLVGRSAHQGHREIPSNSTRCPDRMLSHVQRYRNGGTFADIGPVEPPLPIPPPVPEEHMKIADDSQLAALVIVPLWSPIPFALGNAIPDAWMREYRAGRYRGRPVGPEQSFGENDEHKWQEFAYGVAVYVDGGGDASWIG